MKRATLALTIFAVFGSAGLSAQALYKGDIDQEPASVRNRIVYDGNWWFKNNDLTQRGFLDGVVDYLYNVQRAKWVKGSTYDAVPKITAYYNRDRRNLPVLVPDAWRQMLKESPPAPPLPGGEVWKGPHGYMDGDWYRMGSYQERIGYLQAYLWCLRTYEKRPAAEYPRPLEYYDDKIWDYVESHKNGGTKPAADILALFRSAVSK